jgi:hypothetical protein
MVYDRTASRRGAGRPARAANTAHGVRCLTGPPDQAYKPSTQTANDAPVTGRQVRQDDTAYKAPAKVPAPAQGQYARPPRAGWRVLKGQSPWAGGMLTGVGEPPCQDERGRRSNGCAVLHAHILREPY